MLLLPETFIAARLRLRCPALADASAIFQSYTQDSSVCRFMVWMPHASESITQEFIASCIGEWKAGTRRAYIVTELHSDVAIGMLVARIQGTTVDIGYVLAPSHWGKGFMPEAIQALTGVALRNPGIFRVQATCDTENIPSQRALEKSGFNREGLLERYTIHPNLSPEPRACFIYAKCR